MCEPGYLLYNNACPKINATCREYSTPDECKVCPVGEILTLEDGKMVCKIYEQITNCMIYGESAPLKCLQCQKTYYLTANECQPANEIAGCLVHQNLTQCEVCENGRVLNLAKTECVAQTF